MAQMRGIFSLPLAAILIAGSGVATAQTPTEPQVVERTVKALPNNPGHFRRFGWPARQAREALS